MLKSNKLLLQECVVDARRRTIDVLQDRQQLGSSHWRVRRRHGQHEEQHLDKAAEEQGTQQGRQAARSQDQHPLRNQLGRRQQSTSTSEAPDETSEATLQAWRVRVLPQAEEADQAPDSAGAWPVWRDQVGSGGGDLQQRSCAKSGPQELQASPPPEESRKEKETGNGRRGGKEERTEIEETTRERGEEKKAEGEEREKTFVEATEEERNERKETEARGREIGSGCSGSISSSSVVHSKASHFESSKRHRGVADVPVQAGRLVHLSSLQPVVSKAEESWDWWVLLFKLGYQSYLNLPSKYSLIRLCWSTATNLNWSFELKLRTKV